MLASVHADSFANNFCCIERDDDLSIEDINYFFSEIVKKMSPKFTMLPINNRVSNPIATY